MKSKILFLSTYPPRECGIATFTRDLSDSMQKKFGNHIQPAIISMEESPSSLRVYAKKVFQHITESDLESYVAAAKKINSMKNAEVVNIQHEFGIFGGDYGSNLISFMGCLEKPIVTTFHTVLENPDDEMKHVVKEIDAKSRSLVVMTQIAKDILVKDFEIAPEKILVIPHGVPNVSFGGSNELLKRKFGLQGKKILLTFGLLSRGKAIEYVIKALPKIIKENPSAVFVLVGETHPKVRKEEGESYRNELRVLSKELGVEESVKFLDEYLSLDKLIECLKLADVYLAPSRDRRQICSGTVSYALAAGKAIVSSPNKYNKEVLLENRGIMLSKNDSNFFANKVNFLLANPSKKKEFERNAFSYSRKMTWQNVGTQYYTAFSKLSKIDKYHSRLPRINFRHFYNLSDDFGVMQFSDYSTPLRESGYTLDDNARALSVAVKAYSMFSSSRMLRAADTYLSFLERAQVESGHFHNVYSENRNPIDDVGSEDSFGRAVHSLGNLVNSSMPDSFKARARVVLEKTINGETTILSPRAQANSLIGLVRAKSIVDFSTSKIGSLIDSLISKFDTHNEEKWAWFENYLTYGNFIIPEALIVASAHDESGRASEVAMSSMAFLTKTHFINGKLVPIGQDGWFVKDEERAYYDQQPIEAAGMTSAYLKAYSVTNNADYLQKAKDSFEWFLGRNSINQMVYDDSTGGCFDGITRNGVNLNQGAESTICYLNARLSMQNCWNNSI